MGADAGLGRVIVQTADETPDQVLQKLLAGSQQLWTIAEGDSFIAGAITQIENRDATRVLAVKYIAGKDFAAWCQELHDKFVEFARDYQCDAVEAIGREGLRKNLLAMGWSKVAAVYRVPVNG